MKSGNSTREALFDPNTNRFGYNCCLQCDWYCIVVKQWNYLIVSFIYHAYHFSVNTLQTSDTLRQQQQFLFNIQSLFWSSLHQTDTVSANVFFANLIVTYYPIELTRGFTQWRTALVMTVSYYSPSSIQLDWLRIKLC